MSCTLIELPTWKEEKERNNQNFLSANGFYENGIDMTVTTMRAFHAITIVATLLILNVKLCKSEQVEELNSYFSRFLADLWLEGADVVKFVWRDCSKKFVNVKEVIEPREYFPKFVRCMKRKTLRALDRSLSTDVVPIADGVNLVRFELLDGSGNVVPENQTRWTDQDLERDWRTLALQRIGKVLRTHVIKFDLDGQRMVDKAEYRGRRRYHMMTMMMFGIVSIGMVLVPMGFQFLAVLGGKALLLAKMALILASIQGLKKIATNPLNYGFYHSYPPPPPPPPPPLPFEHFEKRSHSLDAPSTTLTENNPDTRDNKLDSLRKEQRDQTISNEIKTDSDYSEARYYPVYPGIPGAFSSLGTSSVSHLTASPGEVQADVSLEMPYNGFRFQTPATVVSA